jgi:hypothetical protein
MSETGYVGGRQAYSLADSAGRRERGTSSSSDPGRTGPWPKARILLVVLALTCFAVPPVGNAQSNGKCEGCISAAGCDAQREACVADCRARLFNIDPKRPACIAGCSNAAAQCERDAEKACLEKSSCR